MRHERPDSETEFTRDEMSRIVEAVWQHGRVTSEADGDTWRQDACGAWMMREQFGNPASPYGWKIEKIEAGAAGDALRPFNCANGFDIASGKARCGLTADRTDVPAERQAAPPRNRAA